MYTQKELQKDIQLVPLNIESSLDFVSDTKIKEALNLVETLNFDKLNSKLVNQYGWDKAEVSATNSLYKEWLALHICYPGMSFTPNIKLDEYWHMHILDTKAYAEDCLLLFGEFLHHYPYFGLEGDAQDSEMTFDFTNELFNHHFGHTQSIALASCKSSKCDSSIQAAANCKSSDVKANCKSDLSLANCKSEVKTLANCKSSLSASANCKSTKISANCKSETSKQANCKSNKQASCKSSQA
ncbi:hypothetical protein BKH43_07210 [Helicobacter sp. 13S00401-1]|uniref:glycine-rich domain-containing protein n=1 Tax=Helicobacter sp. 13S00401-1 TaxID=1905758 RepID=UPI000BA50A9F|nr:hypothetical protein [Helicobacter sp. 13S00401-1]PAF49029.1 hypothetical protein BKH43_07210 [Helicobacter sp. 13S00401-1]